jgi:hypothetical protein
MPSATPQKLKRVYKSSSEYLKKSSPKAIKLLGANKYFVLLVVVIAFSFYWYEMRPVGIRNHCAKTASEGAVDVLKSRLELDSTSYENKRFYKELIKEEMHLKPDYDSYFKKCLSKYGITD